MFWPNIFCQFRNALYRYDSIIDTTVTAEEQFHCRAWCSIFAVSI